MRKPINLLIFLLGFFISVSVGLRLAQADYYTQGAYMSCAGYCSELSPIDTCENTGGDHIEVLVGTIPEKESCGPGTMYLYNTYQCVLNAGDPPSDPVWVDGNCNTGTWSDCEHFTGDILKDGQLFNVSLRPDGSVIQDSIVNKSFPGLSDGETFSVPLYQDNGDGTGTFYNAVVTGYADGSNSVVAVGGMPDFFPAEADAEFSSTVGLTLVDTVNVAEASGQIDIDYPGNDIVSESYVYTNTDLTDFGSIDYTFTVIDNEDGTITETLDTDYNYDSGGSASTSSSSTTGIGSANDLNAAVKGTTAAVGSVVTAIGTSNTKLDDIKGQSVSTNSKLDGIGAKIDTSNVKLADIDASLAGLTEDIEEGLSSSITTGASGIGDDELDGFDLAIGTAIDDEISSADFGSLPVEETLTSDLINIFPASSECTGMPIEFTLMGQNHSYMIECDSFNRAKEILSWLFYIMTVMYITDLVVNCPPLKD